jgi:hypothetical protein
MGKGHGGARSGSGRRPSLEPPTPAQGRDWAREILAKLNAPKEAKESYELEAWRLLTEAQDLRIRLDARKLLYSYLFGKPIQPVTTDEQAPPVTINITSIPRTRERA